MLSLYVLYKFISSFLICKSERIQSCFRFIWTRSARTVKLDLFSIVEQHKVEVGRYLFTTIAFAAAIRKDVGDVSIRLWRWGGNRACGRRQSFRCTIEREVHFHKFSVLHLGRKKEIKSNTFGTGKKKRILLVLHWVLGVELTSTFWCDHVVQLL